MNPESLKSELQQVLNNDLALRKEFSELKRSLSDYRNQLIIRDEDCLRLQVTIDVLNTKLGVLERENGNYKTQLASLKESHGQLTEEIARRQEQIEAGMREIADLKAELNDVISGYEQKLEEVRTETGQQVHKLQEQYNAEVQDLKQHSQNGEASLREEYDRRMAAMSAAWAEKEEEMSQRHNDELIRLGQEHEGQLSVIREQYNSTLSGLSATSHEEVAELKVNYETTILELEQKIAEGLSNTHNDQDISAGRLQSELEEQRLRLLNDFNANLETLAAEYADREERLRAGYESRLAELKAELALSAEELALTLEHRIMAVRNSHEEMLKESNLAYENRIADLINSYEEKISNLLIHSNASNSKLSAELDGTRSAFEESQNTVEHLNKELESKTFFIDGLSARVDELCMQLQNEQERSASLNEELGKAQPAADTSNEEELERLNDQISQMNRSHSEYVAELSGTIGSLNDEIQNMSHLFASATNNLAEVENELEQKNSAIEEKNAALELANQKIAELEEALAAKSAPEPDVNYAIVNEYEQRLASRELEFQKLLVENSNIIRDIESVQRENEIKNSEIELLKSELEEVKAAGEGRAEALKEAINVKNFEITNLEGGKAALVKELELVRAELEAAAGKFAEELSEQAILFEQKTAELQATVTKLQAEVGELSARGVAAETKSPQTEVTGGEQEAYIDRLFKQIDNLNNERILLLDEKEQMAMQLLKMNEVIGDMSQYIETEEIDVTSLNNHRKSTILAGNSKGAGQNAPMKKQINELVREIDKCIALLSA